MILIEIASLLDIHKPWLPICPAFMLTLAKGVFSNVAESAGYVSEPREKIVKSTQELLGNRIGHE